MIFPVSNFKANDFFVKQLNVSFIYIFKDSLLLFWLYHTLKKVSQYFMCHCCNLYDLQIPLFHILFGCRMYIWCRLGCSYCQNVFYTFWNSVNTWLLLFSSLIDPVPKYLSNLKETHLDFQILIPKILIKTYCYEKVVKD